MRKLRRDGDVGTVLRAACGPLLASRFLASVRAACLRLAAAPPLGPDGGEPLTRRRYRPPRSARAHFKPYPVHDANSEVVRRQAIALLLVLAWLRPGRKRTGHALQGHQLNMGLLAWRVGIGKRELQRYLTVWEDAGVLRRWQPPASSEAPKGRYSGHCFNMFELAEDMPPELRAELELWHGKAAASERESVVVAAAPVQAPAPGVDAIGDGADAMAWLKRRAAAGPP